MSFPTDTVGVRPQTLTPPARSAFSQHRKLACWGAAAVLLAIIAGLVYIQVWPYARKDVLENLAETSGSNVTVEKFHKTHFPPGCVLEGVVFRNGPKQTTFITIDKLIIEGSFFGSLRHHVRRITAVGAQVFIQPFGSATTIQNQQSKIVVDDIVANGTKVAFLSSDSHQPPFVFDIHNAVLSNVRWGSPISYQLKLHNPQPPGELSVHGSFGGWVTGHPEDTPLSGDYTFENADLSVYGGIAGMLSSMGKFDGPLKQVNISGTTDIPDFEVTSGGHKVKLTTNFDAYVDATRGDTFLKRVEAHLGRTTVIANGSVAGSKNHSGKEGLFQLVAKRGRIEDILGLFISDPQSPMSGIMSLKAHATVPTGDDPFLKRISMGGDFGIGAGSFTNQDTQKEIDSLSAGARGQNEAQKENPETVLTDLSGNVDLIGGVADFHDLSFGVPGAKSRLHGTYDLLSHRIDLHGRMRVDTKISKTTTGVKSLFLKLMDPIFKKKKEGEVVPVYIKGTWEKPQCGLDLAANSKQ